MASLSLLLLFAFCVSAATNITIDDLDSSITYIGTWNVGSNEANSYDGGHHSTTDVNAKATLTFNGRLLQIYYIETIYMDRRYCHILSLSIIQ